MGRGLLSVLAAFALAACGAKQTVHPPSTTTKPATSAQAVVASCLVQPTFNDQLPKALDDLDPSRLVDPTEAVISLRASATAMKLAGAAVRDDPNTQAKFSEAVGLIRSAAAALAQGDHQSANNDLDQVATLVNATTRLTMSLPDC